MVCILEFVVCISSKSSIAIQGAFYSGTNFCDKYKNVKLLDSSGAPIQNMGFGTLLLIKAKFRPLRQNWDFLGPFLELSGTLSLFSRK